LGRTPLRPELARAHLLYGEWLRRENPRLDARHQLNTAYSLFTDIGAEAFAEHARRELLATGEKARKREVDAQSQLTPQEKHINRLARDGRTNAEIAAEHFISTRTVEWHMRKVFAKLGITSRRDLHRTAPARPAHAAGLEPIRSLFVSSGSGHLFEARDVGFFGSARLLGHSVSSGPGVALPKSRSAGCNPAALATEPFPGCPPGPVSADAEVAAARRASARRCR
jgi:DNA-binding CsgD family transcriptional regulator